jgi:hypothetical protein
VTKDNLLTAIREDIPFVIKMADGEKYEVTESYKIAVGKSYAMVVDKRDLPHVLPMRTMTDLSYLKRAK